MAFDSTRVEPGYGSGYRSEHDVEHLRGELSRLQEECDTLRWAVGHDELTGLPNRRLFARLAPDRLRAGTSAVVLLMDLNTFKPINDVYGHEVGDRVLQIIGHRLRTSLQDGLIARIGGDEFVGVLSVVAHPNQGLWWVPIISRLLSAVAEPMMVAGTRMSVTGSVGIAAAENGLPIEDLMHRADMAMYEAKIHGIGYAAWDTQQGRAMHAPAASASDTEPGAPTIDPYRRDPAEVQPAGSYQPADPVWVFRHGGWRPGVVESASRRAVMATYRRHAGAGTVVDTMGPECVLPRTGADPRLDQIFELSRRVA